MHNEVGNIATVYQDVFSSVSPLEHDLEVVIVDDCSSDGTDAELKRLQSNSDHLVIIRHPKRLGQSAAIATAISATEGDVIATLDGDGQNVAQDITLLLEQLTPDTVCVNGIRSQRNDPWLKVFSSKVANSIRRWLLNDPILDAGCGVKVVRREALSGVPYFNGMHRFLPTMLHMQGHLVKQVVVRQRERKSGDSKYAVNDRLWKGIADCFAMIWFRRYCFTHIKVDSAPPQTFLNTQQHDD